MRGIEISQAYFEEFGMPMLQRNFPELLPFLAAGLFGSGSECFGFDDPVSRDHDFDFGFMLLLPGEDVVNRKQAFALERAYGDLPHEFMGLERPKMAPVGGMRRGVMRTEDFFKDKTGSPEGLLSADAWLLLPSHALAEAVNGKVFYDGLREVTKTRRRLSRYPRDIRRKKIAGHLLLAGQAGQYNYKRCLDHGDPAAAQLSAITFAENAMAVVFLLNDVYMPFYKWRFRAMRNLEKLSLVSPLLEYLITTGNDEMISHDKHAVMEEICDDIIKELTRQNLTNSSSNDLEKQAYEVNGRITDADLRNRHVLAGILT